MYLSASTSLPDVFLRNYSLPVIHTVIHTHDGKPRHIPQSAYQAAPALADTHRIGKPPELARASYFVKDLTLRYSRRDIPLSLSTSAASTCDAEVSYTKVVPGYRTGSTWKNVLTQSSHSMSL